jgi:hypothetical protein
MSVTRGRGRPGEDGAALERLGYQQPCTKAIPRSV